MLCDPSVVMDFYLEAAVMAEVADNLLSLSL